MNSISEPQVQVLATVQNWMEGEALRQLFATAKLDGMIRAVGFPDLHPGKGSPNGAAFVTEDLLYPHLIGGDIGCGLGLFRTSIPRRKAKPEKWAKLPFRLELPWDGDVAGCLATEGLGSTAFDHAFGTVGAGNHFAELQAVDEVREPVELERAGIERESVLMLVHSGSRGLGEAIYRGVAAEHGAAPLPADSRAARAYLKDHDFAVRWAGASRRVLAGRMAEAIGADLHPVWDGCHNGVTPRPDWGSSVWLHRKGASSSEEGPLVIPGSRGTHSYLVRPLKAEADHAWSVAHGAGRKWSRSETRSRMRERFRPQELVRTVLGSHVICEERDLLYEEAPAAYKCIDRVVQDLEQHGLVRVIARLRPLLTYKTRRLGPEGFAR